ncbi:stimulator of interferon genes protein homolog [Euwallacea similis]|uniref:stimulator of interferon genes protein homolog n=1 Tax=Euwallacea similis TaxID=1736056 RepID=UPI003450A755
MVNSAMNRASISEVTSLKKACVKKYGDRYFFPKTIPKNREHKAIIAYIAILLLIISGHFVFSTDPYSIPSLYASLIIFYLLVMVLHRWILFLFELEHSVSRYNGDNWKIFKAAFYFNYKIIVLALFCLVYLIYYLTKYGFPSLNDNCWILVIPSLFIIHILFDTEECPLSESLAIAKDNGLNYGAGMAYSFFYGYINYMLNEKMGDPNKHLKEMMQDYESKNNIRFEVYKIFLLIPKSLKCFESIQDGSKIMEMRSTLLEKKITVAGVRERVYKHSVYSIHDTSMTYKPIYVCAEYATPIKTFMEVYKHTTAHTDYYHRQKNEILFQFYFTLRRILERNGMDAMCELVFYEDMDDKKQYHDTGRILLEKLNEIKKKER